MLRHPDRFRLGSVGAVRVVPVDSAETGLFHGTHLIQRELHDPTSFLGTLKYTTNLTFCQDV